MNLPTVGWLNRFVRWKGFQPILRVPVFVITTVIVLLGFFDIQDGTKNPATQLTCLPSEGGSVIRALQRLFTPGLAGVRLEWNPHPLLEPAVIQALQITLALLGLIFSIVIGVRLASRFSSIQCAGKVLVPFIALSLLFTLINIYMLGRPIGMSHAM